MRLGGRRPGTQLFFIDAFTDDILLHVVMGPDGLPSVAFHLYGSNGECVADSDGLRTFPEGTEVRDPVEEVLLFIPADPTASIEYRLYSSRGTLLTCSDGKRTQLFGGIRVDGKV